MKTMSIWSIVKSPTTLMMPKGTEIIHVSQRGGETLIFGLTDTSQPVVQRIFDVSHGSGTYQNARHVGSTDVIEAAYRPSISPDDARLMVETRTVHVFELVEEEFVETPEDTLRIELENLRSAVRDLLAESATDPRSSSTKQAISRVKELLR